MNKLILALAVLTLAGCNKESASQLESDSIEAASSSTAKKEDSNISESKELSAAEAKNFATLLLKKINDDEKFVLDAYELKEQPTLEKYFYDLQAYMQPVPDDFTKSYWPDTDSLSPYTKCDTALRDLQLYANVLSHQLRDDTASMRKIVRQEEADYRKSKAKCEERVNLTYEQALAADEAE